MLADAPSHCFSDGANYTRRPPVFNATRPLSRVVKTGCCIGAKLRYTGATTTELSFGAMRLKEIKLAGFKSFVDPTTVMLPGNRNAVVGPNGCGKSNIIDAVRWVMGESSARQLRAEALADVIFNGASSRPPMSLAAIELLFDNRDGRVGGNLSAYADIAIRREVSRDGHSTYFLNGTRCRRRDVADVFLGTGFGPRSYSIIEQGMISELVEAKPEQLRNYLEEAAGVSKYRQRRRETESRIRHTRDNLARLNDLREELTRQLAHLERQAKAAERYSKLQAERRQRQAELVAIRLLAAQGALAAGNAAVQALAVRHASAASRRQATETALEAQRLAQSEQNEKIAEADERNYRLGAEVSRLEQAIGFDRQRAAQLVEDRQGVVAEQERTATAIAADADRVASTRKALAAKAPAIEAAAVADAEAREQLSVREQRCQQQDAAWEISRARVAANDGDMRVCRDRAERCRAASERLQARLEKLPSPPSVPADDGLDALAAAVAAAASEAAELAGAIADNGDAVAAARQRVGECEHAVDAAREIVGQARREVAALDALQQAALGRRSEDAAEATAQWVARQGLGDAPRLGDGLDVEPGWERAVEAVLGQALQAIVVADVAPLAAPLAELSAGRMALTEAKRVVAQGVLPPLADKVRQPLGSWAAGVFAADSLAEALAHRERLRPGQSIVTPAGVWLGSDWIRTGRPGETGGVIERGRQLAAKRAAAEAAEAEREASAGALADARAALESLERAREKLRGRHDAAVAELARLTSEHDVRRVRLEEAVARAERNAAERRDLEDQRQAEAADLADCERRLATLEANHQVLLAAGESVRAERERDAAARDAARQAAVSARTALHELQLEGRALEAMLATADASRQRLLAERERLGERQDVLAAELATVEAGLPSKQAMLEKQLAARLALDEERAGYRRQLEAIDAEAVRLAQARAEEEQQVEALRTQLESARVERERLSANCDGLAAELAATGVGLADAQSALPANAEAAQWEEAVAVLDRRIARLGPINLAAIDEYAAQSERKEYLDAQHADLETALATLQAAIGRIDQATRTRLKETFDRVNGHLRVLFPKVFGGGKAALAMAGEDWLDSGVTLMAQPPGKRNASIHQLSGGEKAMTAVALIFAIFQLNPSPVCLLDEVDAPLDDTNVARFADLIREMSRDVQFVFVTHNKQTIEMADYLLGVTMQEAGVSRLVSVDVDRAARLAAAG